MIELAVARYEVHSFFWLYLALRVHLATDVVNAGHSLPGDTAETVAGRGSRSGVLTIILDYMTG
jgi:hypothetical protein